MSTVLPSGWYITPLEQVADWGSGGTPSRKKMEYYNGDIPWVKTGDLGDKYVIAASEHITSEAVGNSSAKLFPKGSVAIAMYGATIGKTSILGIDATTNQACGVGYPITGVLTTEFLYYLLINEKDNFIAKAKGGAQPNISQTLIKSHEIGLPPFDEQTRIVQKLDQLLSQVDTLKSRIDTIPSILKKFRQSVLAAAVSGKLIKQEDNNVKVVSVGDVIELAYGKSLPSKSRSGVGYPVFGSNGVVGLHHEFYVKGPFIIIGRKGSFGEVNWSYESGWPIDTTYYVVIKENMNLRFVFYILQTLGLKQLNRSTAIPGLNRNDAYARTFSCPVLKEQNKIVKKIEELFYLSDQIEAKVAAAQQQINHLTQSILAKAFRGELVPQDSNDEPASELLKRIKAQREVEVTNKSKRKIVRKKVKKTMSNNIMNVVEALPISGQPISGQDLLLAAGYPSDCSAELLEQFFLDVRQGLKDKKVIQHSRDKHEQDWFSLSKQ